MAGDGVARLSYVELHCASNFSFLHGASHPEDLAARAAELGLPALALTDRDGLHGVVRFHEAAQQAGLRPLYGSEIGLDDGTRLVLLARDLGGYRNLSRLVTLARRGRPKGESSAPFDLVAEHARGLFALTAWSDGRVTQALGAGDEARARAEAGRLADAFGRENVGLEVQRHLVEGEERLIGGMAGLARQVDLPLVATGGVRHARREDRRLLDVLTCIRHRVPLQQAGVLLAPNAEQHLRPAEEMHALFRENPSAVRATLAVAERCSVRLTDMSFRLPRFTVPEGETAFSYLYRLVHEGAARRYHPMTAAASRQIARELDVIEKLDLAGYFLIVWDIVRFCRERGILCQGRGSAANSAACFCLGITAVDPIGLDLLFERFLSEDRREIPDIDLDIAHARREEVIQYVYRKYGREHAAMTCEVISFRARSSVRDVGKALGLSPAEVDRISKAMNGETRCSPHASSAKPPRMPPTATRPCRVQDHDPDAGLIQATCAGPGSVHSRVLRDLVTLCGQIDDFPRHLGIHVGGMVVCRDPIDEIVPVEPATMPGRTVIQWNKDDAGAMGLVKIDLLGLGMLTLLQEALRLVELHHGERIDLARVPMDDPALYELLQQADTVGVFQVESRAQMSTLPRMKPRCFHDLVIEVALIRPGPIQGEMVHPYLRRRNGEEPVTYPHPSLEPILARTLGVPLFQEQGMKVAITAGGFTPGEADGLRRAMSHSRSHRHMQPLLLRLKRGMTERGFTEEAQDLVVKHVESFANFGFAESHAASFALLVASSAWLKAHYPVEFTAALLNAQPMGFYSPATIGEDARRHGIEVLPVDVNLSTWDCTVERPTRAPRTGSGLLRNIPAEGNGALRLGCRFVHGLGEGLRARIERLARLAPFPSLADWAAAARLPRPVLENLAAAGAFASFGLPRREALWEIGRLASAFERGPLLDGIEPGPEREAPELPAMSAHEATALDYRLIGVPSEAHPVSLLREGLAERGALSARELQAVAGKRLVHSGGLVICRQRPQAANGVTFLTLEDETGFVNVVVRPAVYERFRQLVRTATFLQVRGRLERSGPVINVVARSFEDLPFHAEGFAGASRDFH